MYSINECVRYLDALGCEYQKDAPLMEYTSFRIGGAAQLLVMPSNMEQISQIFSYCSTQQIPVYVLGKGSNVLVSDEGIDGVVILLSNQFSEISLEGEDVLVCEAGASLSKVCKFAEEHSLTGLEFAYGIPGTIGGAVYMNAGAYGGEMKEVVSSCVHVSPQGDLSECLGDALDFSYRHSVYSENSNCIVTVRLQLSKGKREEITGKMKDFLGRRKSKQPLEYPSAGSTFKRPVGNYASALIDSCGLKGLRCGGAMVSTKHAGFIINADHATSTDVEELIALVKQLVYEKTGVQLEEEIKRIP